MRDKVQEMMRKAAAINKGQRSSNHRGRRPHPPDPAAGHSPLSPPPAPPPDARRNLRPRRGRVPFFDGYDSSSSSSEEEDERGRRKVKLVLKLPHSPHSPATAPRPCKPAAVDAHTPLSASSSSASDSSNTEDDAVKPLKKRRISGCDDGVRSDGSGHDEERNKIGARRSKGSILGTSPESTKGTLLPERKALESILDKLQKKDTYRVFAEPVDPEELPDYHEVIEHPMDFGTIRKKLARKAYCTFEQFEDDVFLICSNAMQYNAPHTVYFRQARAIEEMARKNFQILRTDAKCSETERKSEEKIRFSSTEKKPLKKSLYRAEQEPLGSDISSASEGNTCTRLSIMQANASEEPVIDNRLSTARVNAVEKPATSNGLSTARVNAVEKPADSNALSRTRVNAVEKSSTSDGLSKAQAVDKPPATNGLRMARDNSVQKLATSNGPSMGQANAVESLTNANGLSKARANAVEKPAIVNGLSSTQANAVDKPIAAIRLSMTQTNAVEKPATADGLIIARANAVEKPATVNGLADCSSSLGESKSEKGDEFSAKCSSLKLGQTPLDENRRGTYNKSDQQSEVEADSVFDVFDSETKQLVAVGFHSEYSYARSLAQFAAFLGPVGWDIASKRIEKVLAAGVKFGPGWVGEYEPLPTPVLSLENHSQQQLRYGSNLQCRVGSRTNEETEQRSKVTQSGNSKDLQLGLKSEAVNGMPHRSCHTPDGTIYGGQKLGLFGVSAEIQPRISNAMLQQQKDQVAVNFATADHNASDQVRFCNSFSVNRIPVEKVLQRPEFCSEEHKQRLFAISAETQPRVTDAILQKQKDQVVIDFTKDFNDVSKQVGMRKESFVSNIPVETAFQRPQYHSQALKKKGTPGVSAETQTRITNVMLQQQDQVALNSSNACNNPSGQVSMNNSSINGARVNTASERHEYHFQAQKQGFGVSTEAQPRISNVILQNQKDQVAIDFVKAYNNSISDQVRVQNSSASSMPGEIALQRIDYHSEVATSAHLGMISKDRNQVQREPLKQPGTVKSQCGKDALVLTVGGLSDDKDGGSSDNNRIITSLGFIPNQQSGVAGYSVASGSREQAIDFRLLGLSGKISSQPNYSSTGNYSMKQVMTPIPPPRGDNPNATVAAAAAREWMSFGASAECRSVDSTCLPSTQIASDSFHDSASKVTTSAARVNGDSMISPLSQVHPQPIPRFSEEPHVQNRGLVFFPQLAATDLSRFHGHSTWKGLVSHAQTRQKDMRPPDLNIGFQPPGSPVRPSSSVLIDSQHPDLALQL